MGDYFKIVAILKNRKNRSIIEYAFVPHKWESNCTLFWPKRNVSSLRVDASSVPEDDWLKYKCKVKKSCTGLEEAELWEEEYVNASNTEAEER